MQTDDTSFFFFFFFIASNYGRLNPVQFRVRERAQLYYLRDICRQNCLITDAKLCQRLPRVAYSLDASRHLPGIFPFVILSFVSCKNFGCAARSPRLESELDKSVCIGREKNIEKPRGEGERIWSIARKSKILYVQIFAHDKFLCITIDPLDWETNSFSRFISEACAVEFAYSDTEWCYEITSANWYNYGNHGSKIAERRQLK